MTSGDSKEGGFSAATWSMAPWSALELVREMALFQKEKGAMDH